MRRFLLLMLLMLLPVISLAEGAVLISDADSLTPGITLYQGPSVYSSPVAYCYAGSHAEMLDQGSGFVQIRVGQLTGWVGKEHLLTDSDASAGNAPTLPKGKITIWSTDRYQYLYAAPDGEPLAALERNVLVDVLAVTADDGWLLICLADGSTGFIPAESALPSVEDSIAYVTSSEPSLRLHLRAEPTTKSDSLGSYYSGVEVALLFSMQEADGWTRVAVCGQKGWMKTEFLSFSAAPGEWIPPLGLVQGTDDSGLNLRAQPAYDAGIIARYKPGAVVEMLAVHGIWAHVRTQDGNAGYMLLQHLGGDQPASLANTIAWGNGTVRLLTSRPVCTWLYDSGSAVFALPEQCTVSDTETGAVMTVPAASLPVWDMPVQ